MMEFSMDMFRLDGKVALVTGAVYGIGFEIARSLATAGAKIVFNNLNQESVDEGIAHYKEAGIDAKGYVCDVTDDRNGCGRLPPSNRRGFKCPIHRFKSSYSGYDRKRRR